MSLSCRCSRSRKVTGVFDIVIFSNGLSCRLNSLANGSEKIKNVYCVLKIWLLLFLCFFFLSDAIMYRISFVFVIDCFVLIYLCRLRNVWPQKCAAVFHNQLLHHR